MEQSDIGNRLLGYMRAEDFALLSPHLEEVEFSTGQTIILEDRPIPYVVFPIEGLCSAFAVNGDGELIEVVMYGREGCSDMVLDAGLDISRLRSVSYCKLRAYKVSVEHFSRALKASPTLLAFMLRYGQHKETQMAYAALANGLRTVNQRVARWILMAQDRLGDEIPVAHQTIHTVLSVRRAGVTEAMHLLEDEQAIRNARKLVVVRDREKLISLAGKSYGVPEAEYERVIGPFR